LSAEKGKAVMEETTTPNKQKKKADKPTGAARKKRAAAQYHVVKHGDDGALVSVAPVSSAREFGAAIERVTQPGKYSLVRVLKSVELKQGLLAVGATFGGQE